MPKFSLDINGVDQGAAEGREAWSGEVPPTGTYKGILKVVQIKKISDTASVEANRGKPKLNIGVELRDTPDGKYDGYVAWNNTNLVESSIPYVNQFLMALTDGSDSQFAAIKKAFYPPNGFVTDDRQQHVVSIGKWKVNSPEGDIPILVSIKKRGYIPKGSNETVYVADVDSFLVGGGGAKGVGPKVTTPEEVPVEEAEIELVEEDETGEDEGGEVFGAEDAEETVDA